MTDNAQIAKTILAQLGGARFKMMTGAKEFMSVEGGLQFTLPGTPGFVKNKINRVRVILTDRDDYTVIFYRFITRHLTTEPVETVEGVYAENLRAIFTDRTGLDTNL